MSKFKVSTQKSLYKPIEIEIDDKTFQAKTLSRSLFHEISKYEKQAKRGDIDALYKQMSILFNVPENILSELDVRDIQAIMEFVTNKVFNPEKVEEAEEEKNEQRPGDDK